MLLAGESTVERGLAQLWNVAYANLLLLDFLEFKICPSYVRLGFHQNVYDNHGFDPYNFKSTYRLKGLGLHKKSVL